MLEISEANEFHVYMKYATDVVSDSSRNTLNKLLAQVEVCDALQSAGHGFKDAVKYYLPKLLLGPIWHCFLYFDYLAMLKKLTSCTRDKETLEQVEGILQPIKISLGTLCKHLERM